MWMAIPRGRISHPLFVEILDLVQSIFSPLNKSRTITRYEETIGQTLKNPQIVFYPFARTAFFAILENLNLPRGSKIILPTITIKPMLDIVQRFGLEPLFVDVDLSTGSWDEDLLKQALNHKPKIALLTYLFGVVPNLNEVVSILKDKKVVIIEDFSQAFGAKFEDQNVGTFGDFGICSTSTTKTLDTYGGAILVVNDSRYLNSLTQFRSELSKPKRKTLQIKILKNIYKHYLLNF